MRAAGTGRAALYDIAIDHRRRDPIRYGFTRRAQAWVIDLDDVPRLPRGLRWLAAFDARDHVGSPHASIRANLDHFLAGHGVDLAGGRVRTMAWPRVLGHTFNPLSLHWCHPAAGGPTVVVAEVHNTYGGRHCYLLRPDDDGRAKVDKQFYVSPFYPVDGEYRMSVPEPAAELAVTLVLHRNGERPFVATMRGRRRPGSVGLAHALRTPLATRAVSLAIRRHGIALWARGLRPVPRPVPVSQPTVSQPTVSQPTVSQPRFPAHRFPAHRFPAHRRPAPE